MPLHRHPRAQGKKGLGIASWPAELKLIVCAGGIYASYLTFGVLQEQIFKYRGPNGEGCG